MTTLNFSKYLDKAPLSVNLSTPVEKILDLFKKIGPQYVVVKEKGKIEGMITKKDLLNALRDEDQDLDFHETLSQMSFVTAISSTAASPHLGGRRNVDHLLAPSRSRAVSAEVIEEGRVPTTSRFRSSRWNRVLHESSLTDDEDEIIELQPIVGSR